MSGGLFRRKNRRRFEDLAVEHIDGVLDEQGERLLVELTRADPELSRQLAEMESVTAVVRSQPQAAPPRSFALPYAPRHTQPEGGMLRWAQALTATAAIVLFSLIGADIGGLDGGLSSGGNDSMFAASSQDTESTPRAERSENAFNDSAGVFESKAATSPSPDESLSMDGASSASIEMSIAADVQETQLIEEETSPGAISALRWAQIGAGLFTIALMLASITLIRRASRR